MSWGIIAALAVGALIFLSPVALIGYINIGGVSAALKKSKAARLVAESLPAMTCSADTDCPKGYICMGGRCMPEGT